MFKPKPYQEETLDVLTRYLEQARLSDPASAFERLASPAPGGWRRDYQPLPGLEQAPYVCLRLPTGGGKTLLAAQTVGKASFYRGVERPLALWLVPTNTIRQQTLETLNNPHHPNREALEQAFGGAVRVLDIADFEQLRPLDLRDKACVVIGTFATLRVNNTEGRRVYADNENLEPHFAAVPDGAPGLDRVEGGPRAGRVAFSFRNILAWHGPLVIVDEAHNNASPLSVEVMQRVNPRCIVEFTATPAANSNILHSVSAMVLKQAEMIKLPIVLTEHQTWQEAVEDAIRTRQRLQEIAAHDRRFIRPIALIQAEDKGREVTYEVIADYLVNQAKIPRERIAIATGTQHELDGVNLLDPNNRVEYVITVEALKEGWDCPFAYVFCSVATVHSKKDVEQLLGRVLRMPYTERRADEELNRAYAHVSSASWPRAVDQLCDRLVNMGFDEREAEQAILPQRPLIASPQADAQSNDKPLRFTTSESLALYSFTPDERASIQLTPTQGGQVIVQVDGPLTEELAQRLIDAVPEAEREAVREAVTAHRRRRRIPAARFEVPQLCLWVDGELELAERELFLSGWNLLDFPAELTEDDFAIRETSDSYLVDIQGQRLVARHLGAQMELDLNDVDTGWTELGLSRWLDGRLPQPDVRQEVNLEFMRRLVAGLVHRRHIAVPVLARARLALQNAVARRINMYRLQACRKGYQDMLFGPQAAVQTSYDYRFSFDPRGYPAHWTYDGTYQFKKHFYPLVGELDPKGDEFDCARAIDQCPQVACWVRNVPSQSNASFRLPTSTDYFYPDFVALLTDGRILVVEYKGGHLLGPDTEEKQNVGELWEEKSNGRALFLLALKEDARGRDVSKQLAYKLDPARRGLAGCSYLL